MHPQSDRTPLSPEAQRLVMSCQGLVRNLAWKLHRKVSRHIELDDLIGYGQVGLMEAARRFDLNRGLEFTTFAYHRIRGAILDGMSRMSWFNQADYFRGRYESAASEALQSSEGETDMEALSDTATRLGVIHLFCQLAEGSVDPAEQDQTDPSEAATRDELKGLLVESLESLDSEARNLIQAIYFEGLTMEQAGNRAGYTKSWASRTHAKAIRTLAKTLCEPETESLMA